MLRGGLGFGVRVWMAVTVIVRRPTARVNVRLGRFVVVEVVEIAVPVIVGVRRPVLVDVKMGVFRRRFAHASGFGRHPRARLRGR